MVREFVSEGREEEEKKTEQEKNNRLRWGFGESKRKMEEG